MLASSIRRALTSLALLAAVSAPALRTAAQSPAPDTLARPAAPDTMHPRSGYTRDPATATALAVIIPGAGYVYAGEWMKAPPTYLLTVGTAGAGIMGWIYDRCTVAWMKGLAGSIGAIIGDSTVPAPPRCDPGSTTRRHLVAGSLILGGVALYGFQIWDAHRAVARQRARHERAAARRLRLTITPSAQALGVGATLEF